MSPAEAGQPPVTQPGVIVRSARTARGLTLAQLGQRTGYSPSQVSRYERGVTPLTDIAVLRRFADALAIPPHAFGLAPAPGKRVRHSAPVAVTTARSHGLSSTVTDRTGREDSEEDPVRRRQLMASLAMTAAASARAAARSAPDSHAR